MTSPELGRGKPQEAYGDRGDLSNPTRVSKGAARSGFEVGVPTPMLGEIHAASDSGALYLSPKRETTPLPNLK